MVAKAQCSAIEELQIRIKLPQALDTVTKLGEVRKAIRLWMRRHSFTKDDQPVQMKDPWLSGRQQQQSERQRSTDKAEGIDPKAPTAARRGALNTRKRSDAGTVFIIHVL
ncbi:uncharacterized protein LOC143218934 [Lasioglossum baleicum]|uniref:uncharacterized protein LOC143218934 n=1 Tax=Lasioglossum baleicum TaxID=434251 RepID=UPI003FCC5980